MNIYSYKNYTLKFKTESDLNIFKYILKYTKILQKYIDKGYVCLYYNHTVILNASFDLINLAFLFDHPGEDWTLKFNAINYPTIYDRYDLSLEKKLNIAPLEFNYTISEIQNFFKNIHIYQKTTKTILWTY